VERLQRFFFSEDEQGEPELILPDQACLALRQFLKEQMVQGGAGAGGAGGAFLAATPEADAGGAGGRGESRGAADARDIWELCSNVIAPKTFRVWGALEEFMTKYHGLLDGRARLIEDTNRLRSQNDELKMLLNQCAPPPPPHACSTSLECIAPQRRSGVGGRTSLTAPCALAIYFGHALPCCPPRYFSAYGEPYRTCVPQVPRVQDQPGAVCAPDSDALAPLKGLRAQRSAAARRVAVGAATAVKAVKRTTVYG